MKKSLFFYAAATALMLTACSSEDDILQTGPEKKVAPQEVGFDVYTPAATQTRAGLEGTMTTDRMKRNEYEGGGFGVFGYLVQDTDGDEAATGYNSAAPGAPNFMWNEKLLWNATNQGWYYNPLKYWPNETNNDSQATPAYMESDHQSTGGTPAYDDMHLDRLTFFAYAPYVQTTNSAEPGIANMTDENGIFASSYNEAMLQYNASIDDPNKAVDLLWGVAPSGGLEYTAVNGKTVTVKEGLPLIDMTKPNVNTNMKFLFQHALARIGVTAVAAIDQVGAGGTLDENTKITIEKITLTGYFGSYGYLNLNNPVANVANWRLSNGIDLKTATCENGAATDLVKTTLTLAANHTAPLDDGLKGTIATHLQWVNDATPGPDAQTNRSGVTTVKQSVIQPALIDNTPGENRNWYTMKTYGENELAYSETTPYYTDADCKNLAGVDMPASWIINSEGKITPLAAISDKSFKYPQVLDRYLMSTGGWYTVTKEDVAAGTYDNYQAYTNYVSKGGAMADGDYAYIDYNVGYQQVTESGTYTLAAYAAYREALTKLTAGHYVPREGKPRTGDVIIKAGMDMYRLYSDNAKYFAGEQLYKMTPSNYEPLAEGTNPEADYFVIVGQKEKIQPYYAAGTYYKRDANFFMVVPTNNFVYANPNLSAKEEKLRTVTVQIEYYITTEDGKLANKRAQTKNVVTKDVVFPSIANGKSYNLNLVLGLTSVKMEAEVDDWKVVNVQADLPQNTAD